MSSSILEKFEKNEYKIDQVFSVENDSIGSYEYWGAIHYDYQPDYVNGTISMIIKGDFSREEVDNFLSDYNDEILEDLTQKIEEDEPEYDTFDVEILKDGVRIFLDFTA